MACRLTLTSRQSIDELHRLTFTDHDKVFHFYPYSRERTARDGYAIEMNKAAKRRRSNKLCRDMKTQEVLSRKQYKLCKKDLGMAHTLVTAYKDMYAQCIHQFQHERWNCNDQQSRINILKKGNVLL